MKETTIKQFIRKAYPHALATILFLAIAYAYFSPQLEGKKLETTDVANFKGTSKELRDYREEHNEEALWTNRLFGGMPAYLISVKLENNLFLYINKALQIGSRPASYLFVCLLSFYLALLIFGVNPWLSMAGAIAFGFSSYFFIILGAGHMTKAMAIAYMPPIIAGVYYTYRKKMWLGAAITGLFLGLQLKAFHPQITYYTAITIIIFIIFEAVRTRKTMEIVPFLKKSFLLLAIAILVLGSDLTKLWMTYEYGDYSMRGKSELTDHQENKSKGGLDREYITAWSYGIDETLTVLIPNFMGGSSHGSLDENSETYKLLEPSYGAQTNKVVKQLPLYFGDQPFTSGPVYFGAVVMLLFVLGLFILKGQIKWWIIVSTLLALMLSWGHNMMWFTNLFIDYFPIYDKFRTVSMTLVIPQFAVPLMAMLAIKQVIEGKIQKQDLFKGLKYSFIITGGIALVFTIFPGLLTNFSAASDQQSLGNEQLIAAIENDRMALLRADAFRSFIFISLAAGVLLLYSTEKLKQKYLIAALGVLFIADMWPINKRYINDDNFARERKVNQPFTPTTADRQIMQDDSYYRVYNTTARLDQDARTSYFHNSLGGYHGAKMQRYQDLVDRHISQGNKQVINMLNTKYFIVNQDNKPMAQQNPGALGNAWFVSQVETVPNADEEIAALKNFDAAKTAIVDERFIDNISTSYNNDSLAQIKLTKYDPKRMEYRTKTSTKQLAVFSEIFYPEGWQATIDGEPAKHVRVNYILRALEVPAGEHSIVFEFKPKSYYTGRQIALVSSLILLLFVAFIFGKELKESLNDKNKG
jgi:hypothetical protein